MTTGSEPRFVFNIVWTGRAFDHLVVFFLSLMHRSDVSFRFVVNACPPDQVAKMERLAAAYPERVIEVLEVSAHRMVRHGDALDAVLAERDDGEFFSFIDADILARGPFMDLFEDCLAEAAVVTSGREVWSSTNTRPEGHLGVNGEYFFDQDGYVFGSPHLAVYRRAALDATSVRWGVGFSSAGQDLSETVRGRLAELGRNYLIFDTGKVVNVLVQGDGGRLVHLEHPDLIHVGGVSHFLAPPPAVTDDGRPRRPRWGETPDWGEWDGMAVRYAVAEYTASLIVALAAGEDLPAPPIGPEGEVADRIAGVTDALIDLDGRFGAEARAIVGAP